MPSPGENAKSPIDGGRPYDLREPCQLGRAEHPRERVAQSAEAVVSDTTGAGSNPAALIRPQ